MKIVDPTETKMVDRAVTKMVNPAKTIMVYICRWQLLLWKATIERYPVGNTMALGLMSLM